MLKKLMLVTVPVFFFAKVNGQQLLKPEHVETLDVGDANRPVVGLSDAGLIFLTTNREDNGSGDHNIKYHIVERLWGDPSRVNRSVDITHIGYFDPYNYTYTGSTRKDKDPDFLVDDNLAIFPFGNQKILRPDEESARETKPGDMEIELLFFDLSTFKVKQEIDLRKKLESVSGLFDKYEFEKVESSISHIVKDNDGSYNIFGTFMLTNKYEETYTNTFLVRATSTTSYIYTYDPFTYVASTVDYVWKEKGSSLIFERDHAYKKRYTYVDLGSAKIDYETEDLEKYMPKNIVYEKEKKESIILEKKLDISNTISLVYKNLPKKAYAVTLLSQGKEGIQWETSDPILKEVFPKKNFGYISLLENHDTRQYAIACDTGFVIFSTDGTILSYFLAEKKRDSEVYWKNNRFVMRQKDMFYFFSTN